MVSEWLNTSEIIDQNANKPCHRLGWCPYGKLVEEFPIKEQESKFTCKVFQHDCPVFYHIEYISEKYGKEDYEKEIETIFNRGGLNEVFSNDKIAEYWYNVGSEHSNDDNILKLKYIIEKFVEEEPNQKNLFQELEKYFLSLSLEEIYQSGSYK